MPFGSRLQHEAPVAIGTDDEILVAHFEIDLGMAKCPADALAGDAGFGDFDDLRRGDRHG